MLFRPDARDFRLIGLYSARVLMGVGVAMLLPATLGFALGEVNEAWGFIVAAALAVLLARTAEWVCRTNAALTTSHGLAAVGAAWLLAPVFAAVPLLLSGHYVSYLDAYFEAMSGFATIGLTLANDIDHMARSVNLWRHLMQFMGGQGIIIVFLTLFARGGGAIGALYVGEGREETILPNVVSTARFIWRVALTYAVVGIFLLWAALVTAGMTPGLALYHGTNLFMAAFDTGGFATQSSSVGFYRSQVVEAVLMPIMVAGGCSFALHYWLWQRRGRELVRNLESRVLATSMLLVFAVMCVGVARIGLFADVGPLFRHAFFQTVSAHTTTGLATVPGRLYLTDWGVLAPGMLVIAMALGGMAGSTAGGIKALRVGLVLKGLRRDLRKLLLPHDAVVVETYHAGQRRILRNPQVMTAVVVLLLWLVLYLAGTLVGLFYGYNLQVALFDSTAAASSGGLSVGVVRPDLETPLKLVYIAQMVLGRLEFVALFVLLGYLVAIVRGRA
ncbi:MAG TPA: potassium transporter TrkG [Egibacteraceae bacterium]|jgi:trk system potassium uptake protein|nr:potassium transporter TrkG [Egibacteraceae bacterium]